MHSILNPKSDTYIRFADDGQNTPQHQQRNRIVWKIWIGECILLQIVSSLRLRQLLISLYEHMSVTSNFSTNKNGQNKDLNSTI